MNIHEYQAKAVIGKFGVPVPLGRAVFAATDAADAVNELGGSAWIVKAQILAGDRSHGTFKEPRAGDQSGVRFASTSADVEACVNDMLGRTLVTSETGTRGRKVDCVYIERYLAVEREFYLSMEIDSTLGAIKVVVSTEHGPKAGLAAKHARGKTVTFSIDPATGLMPYHSRLVATSLGLTLSLAGQAVSLTEKLYEAFVATGMHMLEIGSLAETAGGILQCLDVKVSFDPSAFELNTNVRQLLDITGYEGDRKEHEARRHGLSYIALDGTIGCIVNGAGLAMATLDVVKLHGGEPANFLDIGSGANEEKMTAAFRLILTDAKIDGVLVNIFSGIMKCDVVARNVIAAAVAVGLTVPLVVRLEGTNADLARDFLRQSQSGVILADDLDDAAHKIVEAAGNYRARCDL